MSLATSLDLSVSLPTIRPPVATTPLLCCLCCLPQNLDAVIGTAHAKISDLMAQRDLHARLGGPV